MFTAERSPTVETSHLFKNPKQQICPHNLQTVMSPPTSVVSEPIEQAILEGQGREQTGRMSDVSAARRRRGGGVASWPGVAHGHAEFLPMLGSRLVQGRLVINILPLLLGSRVIVTGLRYDAVQTTSTIGEHLS